MTAPTLSDVDLTPWPAAAAERYRAAGYWIGETFDAWWRGRVAAFGEAPALVAGDTRLSYRGLDEAVGRSARRFAATGIGPGERVLVQLPNRASFLPTVLGLFRIGAVPVFALPAHRRSEIEHLLRESGAVAYVIADRVAGFDHRELARAVTVERVFVDGDPAEFLPLDGDGPPVPPTPADPDAVAFLNLSGGTTGLPKLIPRTPDDYLYSVRESARICGLGPDTRYLCVLPVAHNFSLSSPGVLGVLHAGGAVVLAETPEARPSFALIAREGVTITALVPPLAKLWLDAAARTAPSLPSLRLLQVGGARLSDEVAARVAPTLGCRLQQVFGMAEGLVNYTRADDPDELVLRTQGRPISPDDEIRVVDESDVDVPPGEPGRLLTRGPYTIRGYWRAAAHNATAFTADGFYRTGDVVRRLPSGHLVVEGRVKDQINRGGEKVAVEELENHLLAHPAVLDAAVVAVPDPVLGSRTCAVLLARGGAPTTGEIRAFVRSRGVAEFKVPDLVRVVPEFPTTGVGKTDKAWIRAALTPGPRDISASVPASVRAVGAPPELVLPGPWDAVPVRPGTPEAAVLTDWMSRPHVAEFWDQSWPADRWDQQLAGYALGERDRAHLIRRDGEPLAYLEVYRAARDIVARHYPADPHDLGLHIAIGDPSNVDRGFGRRLLRAAAEALLAADPACPRVVAEPDVRNAMAVRAFTAAGYSLVSECDLGHKRAALVAYPRRNS